MRPELDLVEQEDQLTHEISLSDKIDPEIALRNCSIYLAFVWFSPLFRYF